MAALLDTVDPDGLLEYSVVFTDRSLNHMSKAFQQVMRDISADLKDVYSADAVAIVPGGGSFAMEAVARQLATDQHVMVIRNGWFSFRWTQIFSAGGAAKSHTVMKARRTGNAPTSPFAPCPLDEVLAKIADEQPAIVFAPHVETSAGMILHDDYIKAVTEAVHAYGGLFVLDCVASGCAWVDMKALGVDVLISAPQKGWSASPCAGLIMMSQAAKERVKATTSSSFAMDLNKWLTIMEAYEGGAHAYHATMPTDALRAFRDTIIEMKAFGIDALKQAQFELGAGVRDVLARHGFVSVAADTNAAPGVVVCFTDDPEMATGRAFAAQGMQVAAGVPLELDEGPNYKAFRFGLFGIDKLKDVPAAVARVEDVLEAMSAAREAAE